MSGSSGINFLKLLSQGIHASNASLSWRINWYAWKHKTVKVMIFFMSMCSSSLKAKKALNNLCYFGTLIKYNLRIDFLLSGSLFTYLLWTLFWSQYCLDRVLQKYVHFLKPFIFNSQFYLTISYTFQQAAEVNAIHSLCEGLSWCYNVQFSASSAG